MRMSGSALRSCGWPAPAAVIWTRCCLDPPLFGPAVVWTPCCLDALLFGNRPSVRPPEPREPPGADFTPLDITERAFAMVATTPPGRPRGWPCPPL